MVYTILYYHVNFKSQKRTLELVNCVCIYTRKQRSNYLENCNLFAFSSRVVYLFILIYYWWKNYFKFSLDDVIEHERLRILLLIPVFIISRRPAIDLFQLAFNPIIVIIFLKHYFYLHALKFTKLNWREFWIHFTWCNPWMLLIQVISFANLKVAKKVFSEGRGYPCEVSLEGPCKASPKNPRCPLKTTHFIQFWKRFHLRCWHNRKHEMLSQGVPLDQRERQIFLNNLSYYFLNLSSTYNNIENKKIKKKKRNASIHLHNDHLFPWLFLFIYDRALFDFLSVPFLN